MDHSPAALVMSRTKQHIVTSQQAPGPGSYEPNYKTIVKTENGFKIGGSLKIANHAGENVNIPGPGNYETNKSTIIKDHAVKIGTEKRSNMVINNFTPGPGRY